VKKFILQVDTNGDGNIDQSEFIQMFANVIGNLFTSSQK
jgi:Ca2+-binding EF-hand superfamily protein